MSREPRLGLGHAQRPLPGEAEAGDSATTGHLGSKGDDQAYTDQGGRVRGDLGVGKGHQVQGNRRHDRAGHSLDRNSNCLVIPSVPPGLHRGRQGDGGRQVSPQSAWARGLPLAFLPLLGHATGGPTVIPAVLGDGWDRAGLSESGFDVPRLHALLVVNHGLWNGHQLVPADWIEASPFAPAWPRASTA